MRLPEIEWYMLTNVFSDAQEAYYFQDTFWDDEPYVPTAEDLEYQEDPDDERRFTYSGCVLMMLWCFVCSSAREIVGAVWCDTFGHKMNDRNYCNRCWYIRF